MTEPVLVEPVLVERSGAVTTVIINRPQARNAVNGPTAAALFAAFEQFDADDSASVAVLSTEHSVREPISRLSGLRTPIWCTPPGRHRWGRAGWCCPSR